MSPTTVARLPSHQETIVRVGLPSSSSSPSATVTLATDELLPPLPIGVEQEAWHVASTREMLQFIRQEHLM